MIVTEERRVGTEEIASRLGNIERRLSRIEGGLMLAAFVLGAVVVPIFVIVADHVR